MKIKFLGFIFSLFLILSGSALAETLPAQQTIENFVQNVKDMKFPVQDPARHAELVNQTNKLLDLETMGQKALQDHWGKVSADDQKNFMDLLWKLIENVAYPNSSKFMGQYQITYPEVRADGPGFLVTSVIKQEEQALDAKVVYHVSEKDGTLKIDDVSLDDVSIIEDLKYQFDKLIEKSQFSGLLAKMRDRLAQAEKANAPA